MTSSLRNGLLCGFALTLSLLATTAFAQPGGRGRGGPGFGGGDVLRDENVLKELEIVDDQLEKIRAAQEEVRNEMRDLFSGMRDLSDEERRERFEGIREKMTDLTKKAQEKIYAELLPHQVERLKQIQVQSQMRFGLTGGFQGGTLREDLGITDEQLEKIQELREQYEKEYNEKVAKVRAEVQQKLMKEVLTPEQRAKFEKMVGDPFVFSSNGFGGFGGGRGPGQGGGPGGRGNGGPGGRGNGGQGGRGGRPAAE